MRAVLRLGPRPARLPGSAGAARSQGMILPLALAQFTASYAATNMNVAARPGPRRHWRPELDTRPAAVRGWCRVMLTSSVNVVQSSFADAGQGDISGLSRIVSNLGSSLGTALAGSVLLPRPARPVRDAAAITPGG